MRLRELLNVTILNQIEEKYYKVLIGLFGNPFIDAMDSAKKKKKSFKVSKKKKMHFPHSTASYFSCSIMAFCFQS